MTDNLEAIRVEELAAKFHELYQQEAKRQGDVRHVDDYADLSENIKEFDRVLARYVFRLLDEANAERKEDIERIAHVLLTQERRHNKQRNERRRRIAELSAERDWYRRQFEDVEAQLLALMCEAETKKDD